MNDRIKTLCAWPILLFSTTLLVSGLACCQDKTSHQSNTQVESEHYEQSELPGSITVASLQEVLQNSSMVNLIDVRTQNEVESGKIRANALHFDIQEPSFEQNLQDLDREATYYVYCMAGGRSSKAQETMQKLGFTHVVNVEGGLSAWTEAGFSLE